MKKFVQKIQAVGNKAAQIQQAIQGVPPKIAEARQAIVMSADELHQLRSDVQASLQGLRATDEGRLLQAIREVNDNTYTLEEAGYELTGLDLDLVPPQRLAVHLQKFEDVPHIKLRSLQSKQTSDTMKSILAGIIKAEETAANVELTHLKHDNLVIHIGAAPLIRIGWRSDTVTEQPSVAVNVQPAVVPAQPASQSVFGSYFDQRPTATPIPSPAPSPASQPAATATTTPSVEQAATEKAAPTTGDWRKNALDRFKKMPDLSRHG